MPTIEAYKVQSSNILEGSLTAKPDATEGEDGWSEAQIKGINFFMVGDIEDYE